MKKTQIISQLSILIAVLACIASGAGIFWQGAGESFAFTSLHGETVTIYGHGLYRYDSLSYAAQAIAQDVVTMILGVPAADHWGCADPQRLAARSAFVDRNAGLYALYLCFLQFPIRL